jgi:Dyp-type peroxidase family
MLFARSHDALLEVVTTERARFEGALTCVLERSTVSLPNRHEHFGFADGISQPAIAGAGRPRDGQNVIEPGEFILGYPNEYGKLPSVPHTPAALDPGDHLRAYTAGGDGRRALGQNGSYLVVRQLEQHVYEFWRYMRSAAEEHPGGEGVTQSAVRFAAKCVGRWPSGAPLVEAPERDEPSLGKSNDFGYAAKDPDGLRCPIGAHIRRTNPRDSLEPDPKTSKTAVNRHQLMRRGRSYGRPLERASHATADDGEERGLFFVCVNANIRRQFEFVQQTWVNNTKFDGLYDERDPLIGAGDEGAFGFSIPGEPARTRLEGLPRFVDVRGGEYFFLPSVRAIEFLGNLPVPG